MVLLLYICFVVDTIQQHMKSFDILCSYRKLKRIHVNITYDYMNMSMTTETKRNKQ